ncbi:hypothetical protein PDENDC454_20577 [Paenibacillus dendritiformis C454]|uniref:Uncharacterized protein n=1 Tax=Paenibacillus dendritiformis C454 TaxID=1131935 RepID=H3SKL6_9BACL|nr:hypothetical protein PDENDC454_20577 [Paenibacillus dendritiformis C454]
MFLLIDRIGKALELVKDNQNANLVHEEYHDLQKGTFIGTQGYENYYFRSKNRVALVVIIDNLYGRTHVRAISTGSSEGLFFNIDWGAASNFTSSVERSNKNAPPRIHWIPKGVPMSILRGALQT